MVIDDQLYSVNYGFSDGHTFNAQKNVEYELKKQLQVGDVIKAWGVYKDHTTSKFRYKTQK